MSYLDKCQVSSLGRFPGEEQLDEEPQQQLGQSGGSSGGAGATLAYNVYWRSGWVGSRPPFGEAYVPDDGDGGQGLLLHCLFNWLLYNGNILLYVTGEATPRWRARYLTSTTEVDLTKDIAPLPSSVAGAIHAVAGTRIYAAFYNSSGLGASEMRVWDGNNTSGVQNVEKAFARAPSTSVFSTAISAVALSGGLIALDIGNHSAAVVFTTKNGHRLRPAPIDSTGVTVAFTITADGSNAYKATLTPATTWPAWLSTAELVLAPVDNPRKFYYVPEGYGTIAQGFAGTPSAIELTVAIDDTTLTSTDVAREVEDLQYILQQDTGGNGPVLPHAIAVGTNRLAMAAQVADIYGNYSSRIYVSEPSDYQYMTESQHAFTAPGGVPVYALGWDGSALWFFGPNSTYMRADDGSKPVSWPPIEIIDQSIGTDRPTGILINSTRRYSLVAHKSGLWRLAGMSYPEHPISRRQGARDWRRINWAASAWTFQIAEDVENHLIVVQAALDTATTPSHLLVWNTEEDHSWNRVKYAIWRLQDLAAGGAWQLGGVTLVTHPTTKLQEIWVGKGGGAFGSGVGKVLRLRDPERETLSEFSDDTDGFTTAYGSPPWGHDTEGVKDWKAVELHVRGGGDSFGIEDAEMTLTVRPQHDARASVVTANVPLKNSPGRHYTRGFRAQNESIRVEVATTTNGVWWKLSLLKVYWDRWLKGRT